MHAAELAHTLTRCSSLTHYSKYRYMAGAGTAHRLSLGHCMCMNIHSCAHKEY